MSEDLVLDQEVLKYDFKEIASELELNDVCSFDQAYEYLCAEDEYYQNVGLCDGDVDLNSAQPVSDVATDELEIIDYVVANTSLDRELAENISYGIYCYMDVHGFFADEPVPEDGAADPAGGEMRLVRPFLVVP